jgi:hypothetical protein
MLVEFQQDSVNFCTLTEGEPFLWGNELYMKMNALPSDGGEIYNAVHFFSGMILGIKDNTKVTPVNAKVVVERGNA